MKDPAFLFYPNDWLGGTLGMTFEEKGAYIELLVLQFNRGHMSLHMINNMIGHNQNLWDAIKSKFEIDENGNYFNHRLEIEQNKRAEYSKSRRNNRTGLNKHELESDSNETNIYIIKDLDSGNIKIGASVNPLNRLSTIKSRENINVKLIATASNCTLGDERALQLHFEKYHIRGDWFSVDGSEVIEYMNNHMNKHMIHHMENENENENSSSLEKSEKPFLSEPEKSKRNFAKPSIDEIKSYCSERKNAVDPLRFFNFYESKGWMIGKNKMKDWKAAVRTWENNYTNGNKNERTPQSIGINSKNGHSEPSGDYSEAKMQL